MNSKELTIKNIEDYEELSRRAVKGGFWVFLIRIISEFLYIVKLLILARILSPRDFGLVGVATLTVSILNNFSRTGFESALIQKKDDVRSYLNSAWTVTIIRGLGLFIIILLIAPMMAYFFESSDAVLLIQVVGLSTVFGGLTNIGIMYYDKELQFNKQFIIRLVASLVDFTVTIIIIIFYQNVWAFVFGIISGHAARCIVSYIIHPYRPRLSSDFGKAKELWRYGKWVFTAAILGFLITEGDDVFVGIVLGVTALGFYQLAYKISNLPATEITDIFNQVTFPAYSKMQDNILKLKDAFLRTLKITGFLSFLAGGFILVFAFDFTVIFIDDEWIPMVGAMQILVLYGIVRSLGRSAFSVFWAINKPGLITKIHILQFLLIGIFIYPLTIHYNINGTSFAIFLASFLVHLFTFYKVIKETKCGKKEFGKIIILPLLNMLTVISSVLLLKLYLYPNIRIGLTEFIMLAGIAFIIYMGITLCFDKFFGYNLINEILFIYKQMTNRKLSQNINLRKDITPNDDSRINNLQKSLRSIYKFPKKYFFKLIWNYIKRIRRRIGRNRIIIEKIDGITYILHLNQLIDSSIYYDGYFEKDTTNAIAKLLKPNMIAIDIGANIGYHTLKMAQIVGPNGKVIAFEPMKWALKKLQRNVKLNNFNNIIIENIALSNRSEIKEILFKSSWRIDKGVEKNANIPHPVHIETLDEYLKNHPVKKVDFIKLDVDGYEYKVLQGAIKTLKEYKPTLIMELGSFSLEEVGDKIEDLINFLFSLGYKFYSESNYKNFPDIQSIIKAIPDLKTTTINVILHHPHK